MSEGLLAAPVAGEFSFPPLSVRGRDHGDGDGLAVGPAAGCGPAQRRRRRATPGPGRGSDRPGRAVLSGEREGLPGPGLDVCGR